MSESILERVPPPADARLRYGGEPPQFGDLRVPAGAGPHPCAIVIHGGFWRARFDLTHVGHLCAALTAAGLATWNVEYRRVGDPGGGWPGTFQDVAGAAAYLVDIAADHEIDPGRVIVAGHSAGGHLAFWLAGLGRVSAKSPIRVAPPPRAVVALAGVLDLDAAWELNLSERAVGGLLGGGPAEVPARYAAASPRALLPLGVRQLIVHGTADENVPYAIAEAYHAAAVAAGDDATLLPLPDAGHFELIDPASREWPAILAAMLELTKD
ncbi:MAG: alpha/beta hydrolase [Chloroflexia bacterium]|nr:alpha/beta hydrolase [Chloroflexia bacterium]